MPLARARLKIGFVIRGSSSTVNLLRIGKMKTGAIITAKIRNKRETTAHRIDQLRGQRRTTPTSRTARIPPNTMFTRSILNWSPSQGPMVCVASPYCRSEEHTSELQSRLHLVCRLLLEKKKKKI